jgi:hypothetical protein
MALALPAETILLQAITTPNTKKAVRAWAQSLSADDLLAAGEAIQSYPVLYRKEIMRASSPARRADIWRNHIQDYLHANPNVSSDAVPVLKAAIQLITPELFSPTGDKQRKETQLLADQLTAILGKGEAEYLFYRLGPRDEQISSIEPIGMRLANYVRNMMVALASAEDCDCSSEWGCEGYGSTCRTSVTCNRDSDWPACGWLWNEDCDGLCGAGGAALP